MTRNDLEKICIGNENHQWQGNILEFSFCELVLFSTSSSQYLLQCTSSSHRFLSYIGSWTSTVAYLPSVHTIKHTGPDSVGLAENQVNVFYILQHAYLMWMSVWMHQGKITLPSFVSRKWVDRGMAGVPSSLALPLIAPALALTHPAQAVQDNKDQQVPSVWQLCNCCVQRPSLCYKWEQNEGLGIFSDCSRLQTCSKRTCKLRQKSARGLVSLLAPHSGQQTHSLGSPRLPPLQGHSPNGLLMLSTHYRLVLIMRVTTSVRSLWVQVKMYFKYEEKNPHQAAKILLVSSLYHVTCMLLTVQKEGEC